VTEYRNDVELDPVDALIRRRLDRRGFPADQDTGSRTHSRFVGMQIGWFSMHQLSHLCPDVVMTYFLRTRGPRWKEKHKLIGSCGAFATKCYTMQKLSHQDNISGDTWIMQ
jgi:hypothetical protein